MEVVALAGRLLLAGILAVAGVAKLADRERFTATLGGLGVPARAVPWLAAAVPVTEIVVAIGLLPGATAWLAAVAAGVLLIALAVVVAWALATGRRPDCRCFGQLRPAPIGAGILVRNLILVGVAATVIVRGPSGAGPGLLAWADARDALLVGAVLAGLAVAGAGLIGVSVILRVLRQQGRLLSRVERLEALLGVEPVV